MSLTKKIYFTPPFYFLIHIFQRLAKFFGARLIVYGYYDKKHRRFLKKTRIASSVIIMEKNNMNLSDNVWINHYTWIDASGGVTIEEGCQIGFGSCILSHSSHNSIRFMGNHYMETDICNRRGYIHKPVKIGKYTFIGSGSYVLPGVTIGKGCVVGVNSVVTHDLPDYSIAVGSPARVIGSTKEVDSKFMETTVLPYYYEQLN